MIVYAIKNKDNKYLRINEWRDVSFYDEIYRANLFNNKQDAENLLEQNLDNVVCYINDYEDELCVKDYGCKVVSIEIKEIEPAHQHENVSKDYEAAKKNFANCRAIYEVPKIPKVDQHEDKGE